MNWDKLLNNSL